MIINYFNRIQINNRATYMSLCDFLKTEYGVKVLDLLPEDDKPFSKKYLESQKELHLSDYVALETKKLYASAQIAQEGAMTIIENYLSEFKFP